MSSSLTSWLLTLSLNFRHCTFHLQYEMTMPFNFSNKNTNCNNNYSNEPVNAARHFLTEQYNVDRSQISTSGFSAGAELATQLHVAFSSLIMGAGLIAGRKNCSTIFLFDLVDNKLHAVIVIHKYIHK